MRLECDRPHRAYTNHTILPEAMERWSIPMFKSLLPRIYLIVED